MKRGLILGLHALVGWLCCAGIIAGGRIILPMNATLIIHAVLAPVIFALISFHYFSRHGEYTPLVVALVFLIFIISVDFFIAALLIEKSLAMFSSVLGTWIPFLSIFLATFLTGMVTVDVRSMHSEN
jgi:hypothetical protein